MTLGIAAIHFIAQELAQIGGNGDQVQSFEQSLDRFGSHTRLEGVAVLRTRLLILFLVKNLALFQPRILGVNYHIILEVDHLLQLVSFHVQKGAQAAGHSLEKPNVHNRSSKVDVAHALATHAAVSNLHTALVANHAFVLHAAVLAARTFPVLFRTKNPLAEQTVSLGTVGTIIDGLRLFHLAVRPGAPDIVGVGKADAHRGVIVDAVVVGLSSAVGVRCCSGVIHCCSPDRRRRSGGGSVSGVVSGSGRPGEPQPDRI